MNERTKSRKPGELREVAINPRRLDKVLIGILLVCLVGSACSMPVGRTPPGGESLAEKNKKLQATANALSTRIASFGIEETLQAISTDRSSIPIQATPTTKSTNNTATATLRTPSLTPKGTATVIQATQNPTTTVIPSLPVASSPTPTFPPDVPPDIPLPEGLLERFFATEFFISFQSQLDYLYLVDFYETKMPQLGWEPVPVGTIKTNNSAKLAYSKANRNVELSIQYSPVINLTLIAISIKANE